MKMAPVESTTVEMNMDEMQNGGIAVTVNRDFCRLNNAVRTINEFKMDLDHRMEMSINGNDRLEVTFVSVTLGGI